MGKQVGVWVDRRKAVIVTIAQDEEVMQVVYSMIETHGRPSGGSRSRTLYGPQEVLADDSLQRQSSMHLKKYYNDIASYMKNADYIMLMGPGEARDELRKNLDRRMMREKILAVEPAEKMTDREVAARVRAFYANL
ncbi:MAG TPA: hypothetical protein PKM25_00555 [Candidatus Ozemobacteraceae bacterium]|nr:hypothetical protein [Candidatus Ozemobacteraceae bacterium]